MTHLDALNLRLSNERVRLVTAKTGSERALRRAWIMQIEKEIAGEQDFLGIAPATAIAISADDLLAQLTA